MAEGDGRIYNKAKADLFAALINLANGGHTLKMVLCSGSVPNIDGTVTLADLTQISATNYVVKTLAAQAVTQDDTNDRAKFDGDNITWTALGAPSVALSFCAMSSHDQPWLRSMLM